MDNGGPSLARLIGLGFTIAVLVVGLTALGWFVDSRLRSFPAFVLAGVALGIISACLYAYSEFRKSMEK